MGFPGCAIDQREPEDSFRRFAVRIGGKLAGIFTRVRGKFADGKLAGHGKTYHAERIRADRNFRVIVNSATLP